MADSLTLTIDTRQMQAALAQVLERTRHSAAYVINKKLFYIAKRAYDATPIAKRQSILETFNISQRERTVKKGKHAGRIRRTTNYAGLNRSAFAIMNWHRKKKGKPTLRGVEALNAARRMVAFRLRAVGSLRSGWVGAIVRLRNFLKENVFLDVATTVKRKGTAIPARETVNPVAEVRYRLAIRKAGGEKIDPRVIAALQNAFNAEAADTWRHLTGALQAEANKVNKR